MFVGHPIPGNADIRSRPFQQESFLRRSWIDGRPQIPGVDAIDREVFAPPIYDSAAVLLPESGPGVLPLHDIPGCRRSTGDPFQDR